MFKSTAHLEAQFASDPSKTLIRLEFYTHLHTRTLSLDKKTGNKKVKKAVPLCYFSDQS